MAIKYAKVTYKKFGRGARFYGLEQQIIRDAQQARLNMLRALEGSQDPRDRSLKMQLDTCCCYSCVPSMTQSYNLSLCSVCVERTQRALIAAVRSSLRTFLRADQLPISWIQADLPDQRYRRGDLHRIRLSSLHRRIQRQYPEAGFPLT
jgi:hypothetical protein